MYNFDTAVIMIKCFMRDFKSSVSWVLYAQKVLL